MVKRMLTLSDGRKLQEFDDDDVNHRMPHGTSEHWQESVVLAWWDKENDIGGFHRLGHQPNYKDGPRASLWSNLHAPEGIYKNTTFKPLRDADFLDNRGFGCGDDTTKTYFKDGEHVWEIDDGEWSAELRFKDLGPNVDCFPKSSSLVSDFAANHFDIPGTLTGWMKIGYKKYEIKNGLGVRDKGWGPREWWTILSHRWVVGTCGPEFSFLTLSWHSLDDQLVKFGWVVRHGEVTFCKDLDILTYVEIDAITPRGGHVKMTLTTGEVFDIECSPTGGEGIASQQHGVCCIDRMCHWKCNDWEGVCDFEVSANIQRHNREPQKFVGTISANGVHKGEDVTYKPHSRKAPA
jgi:hypothetical protein